MSDQQPASGPPPLTVHYSAAAATSIQQLDERLRRTLGKALIVLADNPFPPQSEPIDGNLLDRRVRASQSLVVDYRTSDAHLLVQTITRVEEDEPAAPPQPSAQPEQETEPPPHSEPRWERVTVVPPRDLDAPVARHGGI